MKTLMTLITLALINNTFAAPTLDETREWLNKALEQNSWSPLYTGLSTNEIRFKDKFIADNENDSCQVRLERDMTQEFSSGEAGSMKMVYAKINFADIVEIRTAKEVMIRTEDQKKAFTVKVKTPNFAYAKGYGALQSPVSPIVRENELEIPFYFANEELAQKFIKGIKHASKTCRDMEFSGEEEFSYTSSMSRYSLEELANIRGHWNFGTGLIKFRVGGEEVHKFQIMSFVNKINDCRWNLEVRVGTTTENTYDINFKKLEMQDSTRSSLILKQDGKIIALQFEESLEELRSRKYLIKKNIERCSQNLPDIF